MLRWFIFLLLITLMATLCSWLIYHDGSIVVEWFGYHIEAATSFMVLITSLFLALAITLISCIVWMFRIPARYRHARLVSTHSKGLHALTQGFAAIAAGDSKHARKFVRQATACLGTIPLTHILTAQTAQLTGDRVLAKTHYTAMLENPETHIIALRGLLVHAKQEGDIEKAIHLAEKAYALKASVPWALMLLVELYPQAGKWDPATRVIREAIKRKLLPAPQGDRMLGIIALSKSQQLLSQQQKDTALDQAKYAHKLLPAFAPVVIHYAMLLAELDEKPKAIKLLEQSWKDTGHPDVIQAYLQLVQDNRSEKTLASLERLALLHPDSSSGHLAVAQMALDLQKHGTAKDHLEIALSIEETPIACRLMAEVERLKHASPSMIDQWLERAKSAPQPATTWHCSQCQIVASHWQSNCVRCHGFDTLVFQQDAPSFPPLGIGLIDATLL